MDSLVDTLILLILLGLLGYALYEYRNIAIRNFKVQDFTDAKIPESLQGKRMVFVSDFQYDSKLGFQKDLAQKAVDSIIGLKADIVVFGGDFIHSRNRYSSQIFPLLKQIPGLKLGVLGNHDYVDLERVKQGLAEAEIQVLCNEVYQGEGFDILGVDDLTRGQPHLPDATQEFRILLSHSPDFFENVSGHYNIMLGGHFHGGQINIFGLYAPVIKSKNGQKYVSGFVKVKQGSVYVTTGLGGWVFVLPIRFFARPEIVAIDFDAPPSDTVS